MRLSLLPAGLLLFAACCAHAGRGGDVVTMKNGDIHNGTVAQEFFAFETPWGVLSIPYGQMAELHVGGPGHPDRLLTRGGDRFTGRILDHDYTMLRVLQATRMLAVDDIAEIAFARYPVVQRDWPADAVLETLDGSRFFARPGAAAFAVSTGTGERRVSLDELARIDVAVLMDGDEYRARFTLQDGRVLQGEPGRVVIEAETAYGKTLDIPLQQVVVLLRPPARHHGHPDFFNSRPASVRLIRDRLVDGSPAPELVLLDGGRFLRGDAGGDDDEKPPTPVTVAPFAIGVSEVTFEEYERFCEDTRRDRPDDSDWGRGRRPVVNVSWQDAVAYTEWLSRTTGRRYRLPTDAEWEFAARAGTTTRFWWGEEVGVGHANCEGCGSPWDGDRTAPAGSFPPNPAGLYDTAGNVFEWVADCYSSRFADAPADGSAFDKPGCGKRVIRGGAWSFPPGEVRSANRWRDFPTRRSDDTGFRVVRELAGDIP